LPLSIHFQINDVTAIGIAQQQATRTGFPFVQSFGSGRGMSDIITKLINKGFVPIEVGMGGRRQLVHLEHARQKHHTKNRKYSHPPKHSNHFDKRESLATKAASSSWIGEIYPHGFSLEREPARVPKKPVRTTGPAGRLT